MKTPEQLAEEYARDKLPRLFDPCIFRQYDSWQDDMDKYYAYKFTFIAGYKSRDGEAESLITTIKNYKIEINQADAYYTELKNKKNKEIKKLQSQLIVALEALNKINLGYHDSRTRTVDLLTVMDEIQDKVSSAIQSIAAMKGDV